MAELSQNLASFQMLSLKAESEKAKLREEVLKELLNFVEFCRPSIFADFRDCERAEMLKMLEKLQN